MLVKKVKAPSKNPKKCFTPQKKSPGLSKSEVRRYFYVPEREKERGRERDRENKSAGDFTSKPPRPK
jgi:hypothetical protein